MARAQPFAVLAVEILVKKDLISKLLIVAMHRTAAVLVLEEHARQAP